MRRDNKLLISFFVGLFVLSILVIFFAQKDVKENGRYVCGEVATKTPSGEKAFVNKCWREKD